MISFGGWNLFDIPVPGDYDGVGRTEVAVFRPSTGQWMILNPIDQSQRMVYFGATNYFDIPLQAPIAASEKTWQVRWEPSDRTLDPVRSTGQRVRVSVHCALTGEIPSVPAVIITGDDEATSSLPRRKPAAQSFTRLAWLDAR